MERANILVVDDHPENVLALAGTLSRPDYAIVTAHSGDEALKKVLRQEFAVVLLDVLMPGMDGFETARLMRGRAASRNVPIIFLTAAGLDVSLIYKGYSVGAVDYLIKPLDPDILRAKVAVFVDLFRKSQTIRWQEEQLREAERRRNQQALRESEDHYEAAFDHAPVGIAHSDLDRRWVRLNQKFCDILGYKRELLLGRRLDDFCLPVDLEAEQAATHRMIRGELQHFRRERQLAHHSGHLVWVNATASVLRDPAGRPKLFVSVIEDITERKRSEERQRFLALASECLLSSLEHGATLERVGRLAVEVVADGAIIDLSGEPADSGPVIVHQVPDKVSLLRELRRRLSGRAADPWAKVLASGETELIPDFAACLRGPDGVEPELGALLERLGTRSAMLAPVIVRGQALGTIAFLAETRVYGAQDLAMIEDFAHRVAFAVDNARLYKDAREAISARDEFLSIASHELRTPLTPLQIQLQRLLSARGGENLDQMSPERLRSILQRAERQVQRLTALVESLLDVSRLSSGRLRLSREQLDLAEVARDVIARFAPEVSQAGCELSLHASGSVPGCWDRLRIEQVITNLLANALKYGSGRPIEVFVQQTEDQAAFRIRDHGIGIDPEKLERIFGRFERAVSPRSYGGLGLGLYIARQIVEAHGGTILVKSAPGDGTEFTMMVPTQAENNAVDEVEQPLRGPSEMLAGGADAWGGEN